MFPVEAMPSPALRALMEELDRDDPDLELPENRRRFVDACIEEAKEQGLSFTDEEALRVDTLEYLESLLV